MRYQKSSEYTLISYEKEKLKKGIDKVCDVVKLTLGSAGRNVIIERPGRVPRITNDGVSVARQIILQDPVEDLGAQSVINVAVKTNQEVGDGTTTSMVLAQKIVDKVWKKLAESEHLIRKEGNVMDIYRQIDKECQEVVEKIKKISRPVKKKEEVERVAIVSLENEEMGKKVAEIINKLGKYAHVSVEEGFASETRTEVVSGMKIKGKYISEKLAITPRKEAIIEDPLILVFKGQIETQFELKAVCDGLLKQGKTSLVVIADSFSKEIEPFAVINLQKKSFYCLCVKAPSLTTEEMEDVAIYTGATFFDPAQDRDFRKLGVTMDDFGRAKKIVVDRNDTFIIQGKGDKKKIQERIEDLKEQQKLEKTDMFRKRIGRRISALSGGVGLIEVGTETDVERGYLKLKVEDAVCACKAAMEEGIVPGGGLCLKRIADEMPNDSLLKEALSAPYEQIQENAGESLKIDERKIIDPAKVVRVALQNACSFAQTLITVEAAIALNRADPLKELGEYLAEKPWEK